MAHLTVCLDYQREGASQSFKLPPQSWYICIADLLAQSLLKLSQRWRFARGHCALALSFGRPAMFQILLLVCAIDISRANCQPDTALDVIRGPEVSNEMMCGFHAKLSSPPPRFSRVRAANI